MGPSPIAFIHNFPGSVPLVLAVRWSTKAQWSDAKFQHHPPEDIVVPRNLVIALLQYVEGPECGYDAYVRHPGSKSQSKVANLAVARAPRPPTFHGGNRPAATPDVVVSLSRHDA